MENDVQTLSPSLSDRQWAAGAHVTALVLALITSWFAGIAGTLGALGVWMLVRDKSPFAAEHAKEALNFNLSMFLYAAIAVVVVIFTLGIGIIVALPVWLVLGLVWLVCSLIAAFKAYDGQSYRYPLTIRLFR
ncbi:hypothetical protein IP90_01080 [Luteimonas cucumeris]|uniref:Tic20 family protein n=1 Tax=Luteimonas cucumeris TaxID=985012 RepID=A0A562LBE6_9GAMM|nr:DUF4870 domain-containing protein [Luteimonas cucumeris]TWI04938.1 hypothetical protein IP90_01080 [Luteimonas cucumeris]